MSRRPRQGRIAYAFIYFILGLFFLATFDLIDAYLSSVGDLNNLLYIGVRLIWAGGGILMLSIAMYQVLNPN